LKPNGDVSPSFLGRHTTLSYISNRPGIWRRIPYFRQNEGRAPPLVLAVGDRRRVYSIARRLRKPVLVPETAARLALQNTKSADPHSTAEFGRVAVAIGLALGSVPVLVVETQMGTPATQIIMNEILSNQITAAEYQVGKTKIALPHKIVIRVGTAGGINCPGMPTIKVGDVVNASHSIGATGAVIQSLARLDFWRPNAFEEFGEKWRGLGSDFTTTADGHPRVECSNDVVEALESAGQSLLPEAYHRGGNVTKDSLYAELSADTFLDLCRTHNCRSTEMELSAIAVAARENRAHFGMISSIIGLLPGVSFAESERAKALAEQRALRLALETVRNLAHD